MNGLFQQGKPLKVGISMIRSARRGYIEDFWSTFFSVLEVDYEVSELDLLSAYEKGKNFYGSANAFCMFRCLDAGQHVNLIEKGCNCLILLSQRENGKRACSTENYVATHLSIKYPDVKIIDFFLHSTDKNIRNEEITKLCRYFTNDSEKINTIINAWPDDYVDRNQYLEHKNNRINLFVLGDMYYFLNPRMKGSLYVDYLQNKLNCNIITPTDYENRSISQYKKAYKIARELVPANAGDFEHYWRTVKLVHIVDVLTSERQHIDGVLVVSDIWCEMFKEEIPAILKLLEMLGLPYYNLIFNMDSLSTIDTILESFIETLIDRRNKK